MKKCFGVIVVAVFAVAMMAGGAWADECLISTLDIAACADDLAPTPAHDPDTGADGPIVVGQEWLAEFGEVALPLGNRRAYPCDAEGSLCSNIIYVPKTSATCRTRIVLKAENGGFPICQQNLNFFNASGDIVAMSVSWKCEACDFECWNEITFEFIVDVVAGTNLALSCDSAKMIQPKICFTNSSLSAGPMTIQIVATESLLGTDKEIVAKKYDKPQFTARIDHRVVPYKENERPKDCGDAQDCPDPEPDVCQTGVNVEPGPATSLIDLYAGRTKFVPESCIIWQTDTTERTSKVEILVEDAGGVYLPPYIMVERKINEGICRTTDQDYGGEGDLHSSYTLTVNGTQEAISGVTLDTLDKNCGFLPANEDFTLYSGVWKPTGDYVITFGEVDLANRLTNDLVIEVDCTTIIDACARYGVTLEIIGNAFNTEDPSCTEKTWPGWSDFLLADELAFAWDVDGLAVRIPYFVVETGGTNYTSAITVTNHSDKNVKLWMDAVWCNSDETECGHEVHACTPFKELEAQCVVIIREGDVDDLLEGVDDTDIYRTGLTLYLDCEQNDADITAVQKDPNGRTVMPALYKTNNKPLIIREGPDGYLSTGSTGDGRQWQ